MEKNLENLLKSATKVTVTCGHNGYPKGLHTAYLCGTWEDAEAIAEALKDDNSLVRIASLRRRDGWQFYESYNLIFEPYDRAADYNEHGFTISNSEELQNELKMHLEDEIEAEELQALLKQYAGYAEMLANAEDGQILARYDYEDDYYLIDSKTMAFDEDVWHYAIGVEVIVIADII